MSERIFISAIIPNFNGQGLLEKNLPFLITALKKTKKPYEIIVPDDASTDESVEFLLKNHPTIQIIRGNLNLGFSGNINRGIQAAVGDWCFLMNTDIELKEDYFLHLLPYLTIKELFGITGSIVNKENKLIDGGKYPLWKKGELRPVLNYELIEGAHSAPTLFLSGANALIQTQKLKYLGGFNELFNPYYFEDVELSIRAWREGWISLYVKDAICVHELSSTIKSTQKKEKIKKTARRNRLLLHYLFLSPSAKRKLFRKISLLQIFRKLLQDKVATGSYMEFVSISKGLDTASEGPYLENISEMIIKETKGKISRTF